MTTFALGIIRKGREGNTATWLHLSLSRFSAIAPAATDKNSQIARKSSHLSTSTILRCSTQLQVRGKAEKGGVQEAEFTLHLLCQALSWPVLALPCDLNVAQERWGVKLRWS